MFRITALLSLVFVLVGCSPERGRYELVESADGQMYRLDSETGDLSLIEGSDVIALPLSADTVLSKATDWSELTLPNGITADLSTKWRAGNLLYVFRAQPYEGEIADGMSSRFSTNRFTVILTDSEGFTVVEFPIPFSSLTRMIGADGEPEAVSGTGEVVLTAGLYREASNWNLSWNF